MRPGCYECCRKHIAEAMVCHASSKMGTATAAQFTMDRLAQAAILLAETELGYPEHMWLAVGHLALASDMLVPIDAEMAADVRGFRLAVIDGERPETTLGDLANRAVVLSGPAVTPAEMSALAYGHLAEAAEEIEEFSPELHRRILNERASLGAGKGLPGAFELIREVSILEMEARGGSD